MQNFKHPTYNGPMAEPWEFPLLGVVYGTVKIHAKRSICWLKKISFKHLLRLNRFFCHELRWDTNILIIHPIDLKLISVVNTGFPSTV